MVEILGECRLQRCAIQPARAGTLGDRGVTGSDLAGQQESEDEAKRHDGDTLVGGTGRPWEGTAGTCQDQGLNARKLEPASANGRMMDKNFW